MEWYDLSYWCRRFDLGDPQRLLEGCRHQVACYPEVGETLAVLSQHYPLIVTSSSTRAFLPYLLAAIQEHFARIFSSTSDYSDLKSPTFYRKVCQEVGVSPQEMVHVGDHPHFDFQVPRTLGIEAFHLDRKGKGGDGRTVASLRELASLLKSSGPGDT